MSYKVLFSKIAEKEVKNIIINLKEFTQDLNLIQQRQAKLEMQSFHLIFSQKDTLYIRLIIKYIIFEKWSQNIILSYTL